VLYAFLYPLAKYWSFFNVFKYITFRMICGAVFAFFGVYLIMPLFIKFMKKKQFGQIIREEGPEHHKAKTGTPTMGGVVLLLTLLVTGLLWCRLDCPLVWSALLVFLGFGLIGFIDDFLKIKRKHNLGLTAKQKLFFQFTIAILFYLLTFKVWGLSTKLYFPVFKELVINLGWGYLIFSSLVIVGSSNAMNLTDGLDGLAIVPFVVVAGVYGIISYVTGHKIFAHYLYFPYIPCAGELAVLCSILIGIGLGFLWYNSHPAEIFMGDVGSLGLGAGIGAISVMVKQELLLIIAGWVFVMEAMSVILQVGYFKLTGGKRLFKMAPIHHHFELKGWPENKVVIRFWIIAIISGLLALSTLKVR